MQPFDELEEAEIRVEFRRMYADLGFIESCKVLSQIIVSAAILAEILAEEKSK